MKGLAMAYAMKRRMKGSSRDQEHLAKQAQEHEDLAEPMEPSEHLPEDMHEHMLSHGGMIGKIMHKRKMAMGGMVESEDEGDAGEYESDPFLSDEEQTELPDSKMRLRSIMRGLHARHLGK